MFFFFFLGMVKLMTVVIRFEAGGGPGLVESALLPVRQEIL